MSNRYLITCSPESYQSTSLLLNTKIHQVISKMNNYDGSFDFIITCSKDVATELKKG